jgi:hypothetical protein
MDCDVRVGDWMQTVDGNAFWPLDPRPEDINIEEIAAALSRQCRFGGHIKRGIEIYSVAEHSVMVADLASSEVKLAALMHDASEAYLQDIIRPIKPALGGYAEIENRLMSIIAEKFGFQWPMPSEVKWLDNAILADERDQVMAKPPRDWSLTVPPTGIKLPCWSPSCAEQAFMDRFREYTS